MDLITAVKHSLECRQDILTGVYRSFGQLTTELLTLFMLNHPNAYTADVVEACIDIWKGPLVQFNLSNLISERVIYMIENSVNCKAAWQQYKNILWTDELLTPAQIEDSFLKIDTAIQVWVFK